MTTLRLISSRPFFPTALQLSFYVPLTPTPRGEGSFAALLQRHSGTGFGDGYDHEEVQHSSRSSWRTRPLPSAARAFLVSRSSSSYFLPSPSSSGTQTPSSYGITSWTIWTIQMREADLPKQRGSMTCPLSLSSNISKQTREAVYPNCSSVKVAEVFIRRVWLDHPPLPADSAQELRNALVQWEDWKRAREDQARWNLSWGVCEARVIGLFMMIRETI